MGAGLVRVISFLCYLLVSLKRLHRDARIHYPVLAQQGLVTTLKMGMQPVNTIGLICFFSGLDGRNITDDFAHTRQLRIDLIVD